MSEQLKKHTLHLRSGDFQTIGEYFPKLGASAVIRQLVSGFVDKIDKPITEAELEAINERIK